MIFKRGNTVILDIDQVLNLPDFRASERAFQLLVQAAGRSGRADDSGRYCPGNRYSTPSDSGDLKSRLQRICGMVDGVPSFVEISTLFESSYCRN